MQQRLINDGFLVSQQQEKQYDPFKSPPDLQFAYKHRKANAVGIETNDCQNQNSKFKILQNVQTCPCCDNIIDKVPLSLTCQDQQLLFLGVGYPLTFKLFRYFSVIILFVFFISGSAYYFLVTLQCHSKCFTFMGIPILNLEQKSEHSKSTALQIANVFTTIVILAAVLYVKSKILDDIAELQTKRICPSQYSIMLQNLPQNYSPTQLSSWIVQTFNATPIKINQAYDVSELENAYKKKHKYVIELNKLKIKKNENKNESQLENLSKQIEYYQKEVQKMNRVLNYYKQQSVQCKSVGTAFVTFQDAQKAAQIISLYQTSFARSMMRSMLSVISNQKLQFKDKNILVFRAPAPSQIIWQNLDFSYLNRLAVQLIFILTMIGLIFMAFQLQFYVVRYAYELRTQGTTSGQVIVIFEALAMSLIVVLLNCLLRLVIMYFAKWKRHYSYSDMEASFCAYYSLFYIMNSCFMIYIVHGKSTVIQNTDQVLLYDIHIIMLANAFSQPLSKIFEPIMWSRILFRLYIKKLPKQRNPYTQEYVNKLWQGYQVSNGDNYQYITRILFITIWFAHTAPLGVLFSLSGLFLQYWVQRILLLRVYKKPQSISKQLAIPALSSLELLPLVYICGLLQFTYKIGNSENIFNFFYEFLSYGITGIFIFISLVGYLLFFKKDKNYVTKTPYSQVQLQFDQNYQTKNPMTLYQGQINYLYRLLKRTNEKQQQQINSFIQLSRKSSSLFMNKIHQIKKIKKNAKIHVKAKSKSQDIQLRKIVQLSATK